MSIFYFPFITIAVLFFFFFFFDSPCICLSKIPMISAHKAEFILKRKRFFNRFVACAFPFFFFFFEVKSVLPIDRYQNATSKAISLHELKKITFKSVSRS